MTERCDKCRREREDVRVVEVFVSAATWSSPAEYEERYLCGPCRNEPERDEAFERADRRYREDTGSHL